MSRRLLASSLVGLIAGALMPSMAADRPDAKAAGMSASMPRTKASARQDDAAPPHHAAAPAPTSLAEQIAAARRSCDTWARSQPLASSDGAIYRSNIEECMSRRGHAVR